MRKAIAIGCAALIIGCAEKREYRQPEYHAIKKEYKQSEYRAIDSLSQTEPIRPNHCLDSVLADEGDRLVLVDKSVFKVSLYLMQGHWKEEAAYITALGREEGQKTREGDNKTPEGHYKVREKLATYGEFRSEYLLRLNRMRVDGRTRAFGDHALVLDYPNSLDRFFKRNGSGIMLHGTEEDKLGRNSTRGCIGLLPADMVEVFRYVSVGSAVIIVP